MRDVPANHNELIHTARYIKSLVYGGLDGIITTFAVVAGVIGASLSANVILILGFANLIADGISMAAGDYLSTKSEIESHTNKNIFRKITRGKLKSIDRNRSSIKNAIITFVAFVLFGFIPLLSFVLTFFGLFSGNSFEVSIILTFVSLFILGSLKSKITNKGWIKSGMETLVIGGVASGIAYYIGYLISGIV
ncbi:hypothetical protein COU54_05080 [Candidatus Pacearchaeota archaeon CG10_big_fil_rev_8_21_14_0_10_31_24]|nr:MAG: hypothetical protein COU54_05080 [Candidatus Pacearchaeota archaeon CG10_big_fil_rev_8_21_14_0_10_31_24]